MPSSGELLAVYANGVTLANAGTGSCRAWASEPHRLGIDLDTFHQDPHDDDNTLDIVFNKGVGEIYDLATGRAGQTDNNEAREAFLQLYTSGDALCVGAWVGNRPVAGMCGVTFFGIFIVERFSPPDPAFDQCLTNLVEYLRQKQYKALIMPWRGWGRGEVYPKPNCYTLDDKTYCQIVQGRLESWSTWKELQISTASGNEVVLGTDGDEVTYFLGQTQLRQMPDRVENWPELLGCTISNRATFWLA